MELSTLGKEKNRMSEWMIFAERLSEQIKKQNLSIRQLAKRMDMTPTTIFRYAKGQRVPRANEILKASDVLGVTCDYLVGLSDDPKKTSRPSAQPQYEELTPEEAASEITSGSIMSARYWLDAMIRLKQMGYAICRKR